MATRTRVQSAPQGRVEIIDYDWDWKPSALVVSIRAEANKDQVTTTEDQSSERAARPLPEQLIEAYVRSAARRAVYEQMEDDRWFARILILRDVWAEGATPEEAEEKLLEVTRQWIRMKIDDGDHQDLPVMGSLDIRRL